jgi:hypothetical protein
MVNLGPDGYLDGRKGADGHERILDFGFHVRNVDYYMYGDVSKLPIGYGTKGIEPNIVIRLRIGSRE